MEPRFLIGVGIACLVAGMLTWMVRSSLERPMSLRWTVGPVALGVLITGVGMLRWALMSQ